MGGDGHPPDVGEEPVAPRAGNVRGVTIYDVARLAGVAPSTVSRAFARPGRVGAATAARVRAAAEELGYRSSPVLQSPSTTRTRLLALGVSDVTNPVFAELIRGAQIAASEAGYTVVLADAQESGALEREGLERVLPMVEGYVISSSRMSDSTLQIVAKQRATVVVNRHLVGVSSVVTDNVGGMRRAVDHLRDLGHASVTYVAGPEASWADGVRWRALREAGQERSMPTRRVGPVPPTADGGVASARAMLVDPPTAVVAYNDLIAIGLVRALRRARLRVPEDVSVVGFDNILAAELVIPGLTTVAAPQRLMGSTAVRNVLALVGGASPRSTEPLVLPTRLVVRESTAVPRR